MKCRISLLGITLCILLMGCAASGSNQVTTQTPLKSSEKLPPPPLVSSSTNDSGQVLPISAQVQIANQLISLEVANTPQEQAMGLMYRTSLADDRGMLFAFNPPQPVGFWMKNTKIALDMIFLSNGQVKAIEANVPPCNETPCPTYGPKEIIDQVIELRGGRAAELGLKVGDRLSIKFLDSKTDPSTKSHS
jgi:uncharacterized membrane protein (UPF0127 family)